MQTDLRRERRRCRAVFDRAGACVPEADCRGYGDAGECLGDVRAFGAVRIARCVRTDDRCRACCAASAQEGCAGGVVTVDDADFRGAVGDGALSLSEALDLVAGRLDPAALSPRERRQIRGRPGAGRADRVRFVHGLAVAIRRVAAPVDVILPPLTDPGDAILADGTLLDGAAMDGMPQAGAGGGAAPLLVATASDTEIAGLDIRHVIASAIVVAGSVGETTEHVLVRGNAVTGPGRGTALQPAVQVDGIILVAGANASGQRLADVWVRDNRVAGVFAPLVITAGAAVGAGEVSDGNLVDGVHVEGNTSLGSTEGPSVCVASAVGGGAAGDNFVRGVRFERNRIADALDVGLLLSTSCVTAGRSRRNRLEEVVLRRNEIVTPPGAPRIGAGLFVGAQVVLTADGAVEDDGVDGLVVEDNVVDGPVTGAVVYAGYAERCGGTCASTGVRLEHVRFGGNVWRNVDSGLIFAAAGAVEAAAVVAGNTLRHLELAGESVIATGPGIVLQGGTAVGLLLCGPFVDACTQFPGYQMPGVVRDNLLSDVTVRGSHIDAQDGIVVSGGVSSASEDAVLANAVTTVALHDNTIAATRSGVTVIGGVVQASGLVQDSRVQGVAVAANRTPAGTPATVMTLDQAALPPAPPGSVAGNTIVDVTVQ